MPKPVHTLDTHCHCMKNIKNIIKYFNPLQMPLDISNKPVFAKNEIQFRFFDKSGPQSTLQFFFHISIY